MQHQCEPWLVEEIDVPDEDGHCECPKRPTEPPKKEEKLPCSHDKKQDCCEQILEILRRGGSVKDIEIHKPKQSVKVKTANICCRLTHKTSVVPILMLFLRRFLDNRRPENDFELKIWNYLKDLPSDKIESLKIGLKAYDKVPYSLRNCIFETRFDDCDSLSDAFNANFFLKVLLQDAIRFGREVLYDKVPGPGKVRLWEKIILHGPDSTKDIKLKGPWPWICAVDPTGAFGKCPCCPRTHCLLYCDNRPKPGLWKI